MALLIDNYRALLKGHEYFKAWEDELCVLGEAKYFSTRCLRVEFWGCCQGNAHGCKWQGFFCNSLFNLKVLRPICCVSLTVLALGLY